MKFFVAGGFYKHDENGNPIFELVCLSSGKPYVYPAIMGKQGICAAGLYNLTKHHASLYQVVPSGSCPFFSCMTLLLHSAGAMHTSKTHRVILSLKQVKQVKEGIADYNAREAVDHISE